MSRILVNSEWYDEISPASLYETEFETMIMQQSCHLYPHYLLVPFKRVVCSEDDSAKPDLALIEKLYREWWVVEVELCNHSLTHVVGQVETLSRAYYGLQEAEYLHKQSQELDLQSLLDLMKGKQPRVMVIVNKPMPKWVNELRRYEASLGVVQVFRSERNHHILRINGDQPQPNLSALSNCRVHELLPNTLALDSPAALNIKPNEAVIIKYQGTLTEWKRMDIKDSVWLVFIGRDSPLKPRQEYVILNNQDNQLIIEAKS